MVYPNYSYRDFMPEDFPFKIEVRSHENYNPVVHSHDHLQLCYVTSGSFYHLIQGKQVAVIKGDFFSVPPSLEHKIKPREDMEFELIQIDFMPFFINESMRELSEMENFVDFAYIQPLIADNEEILPKLKFSPDVQQQVEGLIQSMQKELQEQENGYKLSIKADLLKLLVVSGRAFHHYREGGGKQQKLSTHRQAFFDTLEYMRQHYAENIRLEQMAIKAHMAPTYFSSIFKLINGCTFIEYLNEIRVHKAIELLLNTDMSVTQISYKVGYNNIGHFNKMFKKITGVTPSEYRKQS
mgnify:CR=1 FL=1